MQAQRTTRSLGTLDVCFASEFYPGIEAVHYLSLLVVVRMVFETLPVARGWRCRVRSRTCVALIVSHSHCFPSKHIDIRVGFHFILCTLFLVSFFKPPHARSIVSSTLDTTYRSEKFLANTILLSYSCNKSNRRDQAMAPKNFVHNSKAHGTQSQPRRRSNDEAELLATRAQQSHHQAGQTTTSNPAPDVSNTHPGVACHCNCRQVQSITHC